MRMQANNEGSSDRQIFPVHKVFDSKKQKWAKHPAVPKGVSWQTYRASERELAMATNLGLVIPEGRVVIDLDTYKGVTREAVEVVLGVALDWEGAKLQRTVTGGEHYCFELPIGARVPQGDSLLGVTGFDTRCAGAGWVCTGDGYDDQTMIGMPDALFDESFPELPAAAVDALNGSRKCADDDDLFALDRAISARPLDDITMQDIFDYLKRLPAADVDGYQTWLKVGMAIHHQTGGSAEGMKMFIEWSKQAKTFDRQECEDKWRSFAKRDNISKPVRFDYVIHRAGGRAIVKQGVFERMAEKAADISTLAEYEAFKREVRRADIGHLSRDMRAMLAHEIYNSYGKDCGLNKTDIKRELSPTKGTTDNGAGEAESPEWLKSWVFVEATCEFAQTELGYAIRREAFNAKFDRMGECVTFEKPAAVYALNHCHMKTVVDSMFWPGADMFFDHNGMEMLNAYRDCRVSPCAQITPEGQAAIDRFIRHLELTIEDGRERDIFLDWLTHIITKPGERVNWAVLLQGAQGTGKSYFAVMMQAIMGEMVRMIDATALDGRFTGWAYGATLIVVEEVKISGNSPFRTIDRLKPFISNDVIQIEEKGRPHRTVPNFASYLMLTNHRDAIPICDGDRRYMVIYSKVQSEEQLFEELGGRDGASGYFKALFDDLKDHADSLAHFFTNRAFSSEFDPKGRAPETKAREMMITTMRSPARETLEDLILKHECEVIGPAIVDYTWLAKLCAAEGEDLPKTYAAHAVLLEMGYSLISGGKIKISGYADAGSRVYENHRVWFKKPTSERDAKDATREFFRKNEDPDYVPF